MRQISFDAAEKFMQTKKFKRDNTEVVVLPNVTILKLYDNEIAYLYNDPSNTLSITNCGWDTNTTKDRLNALPNVSISQLKGKWYLNNELWNGKLIDIKK
tara:strand:- start:15419 stop:15718 length:300 start_codon:yes stop_codon:yes gene_type:complete